MKKVLVLVFSDLKHDARVSRQVEWLTKKYNVTVVCFDSEEIPGITIIRVQRTPLPLFRKASLALALLTRQYRLAYRILHQYERYLTSRLTEEFDLIVANDIDSLPLAFRLKSRKVLFDAHEYAPRHFENNTLWRIFFQPFYVSLCRNYIPRVDGMLTVGQGLATEYEKNFGVRPTIITNATRYHDQTPTAVRPDQIRLIHHGIVNESRRIELMIEMVSKLDDRFTLDLILMTSEYASGRTKQYIKSLQDTIAKTPRIRWLPSVKSHEVVNTIHRYDIGVFLIPPVNFNYANTLPNKLFDFIQARLGIAIGPTPEMASVVRQFENGVVSGTFNPHDLAQELNKLTYDQVVQFKINSAKAASQLNAEKNEVIFNSLVGEIVNSDTDRIAQKTKNYNSSL